MHQHKTHEEARELSTHAQTNAFRQILQFRVLHDDHGIFPKVLIRINTLVLDAVVPFLDLLPIASS